MIIIETFAGLIRQALGRQLSARDMAEASSSIPMRLEHMVSDTGVAVHKIGKREDGTFKQVEIYFATKKTIGPSYSIQERGEERFYPQKTVTSEYDSSGKITQREVRKTGNSRYSWTHYAFDVPGKIIGRKVSLTSAGSELALIYRERLTQE